MIPMMSATDLTICKTVFSRPKDWVDITAMLEAGTVDVPDALGWVAELTGTDDDRYQQLAQIAHQTTPSQPTLLTSNIELDRPQITSLRLSVATCGHWMPVARRLCSLSPRHKGRHR